MNANGHISDQGGSIPLASFPGLSRSARGRRVSSSLPIQDSDPGVHPPVNRFDNHPVFLDRGNAAGASVAGEALIACELNDLMRSIHNRMPVILTPSPVNGAAEMTLS
jgi:hypothetical protein